MDYYNYYTNNSTQTPGLNMLLTNDSDGCNNNNNNNSNNYPDQDMDEVLNYLLANSNNIGVIETDPMLLNYQISKPHTRRYKRHETSRELKENKMHTLQNRINLLENLNTQFDNDSATVRNKLQNISNDIPLTPRKNAGLSLSDNDMKLLSPITPSSYNNFFDEKINDFCAKLNSICNINKEIAMSSVLAKSRNQQLSSFEDLFFDDTIAFPNDVLLQQNDPVETDGNNNDDDDDDGDEEEVVPSNDKNMLKCSEIWDRITVLPKFTQLDIDGLCNELMNYSKCSKDGVVIDSNDVSRILLNHI